MRILQMAQESRRYLSKRKKLNEVNQKPYKKKCILFVLG